MRLTLNRDPYVNRRANQHETAESHPMPWDAEMLRGIEAWQREQRMRGRQPGGKTTNTPLRDRSGYRSSAVHV